MPIYWVGAAGMHHYPTLGSGGVPSVSRVGGAPAVQPIGSRVDSSAGLHARIAYQKQQEHPPPKPVFYVADVMTSPVTTLPVTATIEEAREFFRTHRFRHLPIVDGGPLVGILSDRDILRGTPNSEHREFTDGTVPQVVADLMSTTLLTATRDTPIREAARVMADERLGALPVLDDDHHLIGIVTTSDLLRCIVQQPGLELWA